MCVMESNKKESTKLEIPLMFLKDPTWCFPSCKREHIDQIIGREKITFSQYKVDLIKTADLQELKFEVLKISRKKIL